MFSLGAVLPLASKWRNLWIKKSVYRLELKILRRCLLGLLSHREEWSIQSNVEFGDGFSDILILDEETETDIVIEVKKSPPPTNIVSLFPCLSAGAERIDTFNDVGVKRHFDPFDTRIASHFLLSQS